MKTDRKSFQARNANKAESRNDIGVTWNPRFRRCDECVDFVVHCASELKQPPTSRKCVFWGSNENGRFKEIDE